MDSKRYAWKWVDADECLAKGPCEFVYSKHVPSAAGTSTIDIYDGTDTGGKKIIACRTAESRPSTVSPPVPIYCETGLFIDIKANCLGVLVIWRRLEN